MKTLNLIFCYIRKLISRISIGSNRKLYREEMNGRIYWRYKTTKYNEQYLKELRAKAKKNWLGKIDPDKWLKQIRGGYDE